MLVDVRVVYQWIGTVCPTVSACGSLLLIYFYTINWSKRADRFANTLSASPLRVSQIVGKSMRKKVATQSKGSSGAGMRMYWKLLVWTAISDLIASIVGFVIVWGNGSHGGCLLGALTQTTFYWASSAWVGCVTHFMHRLLCGKLTPATLCMGGMMPASPPPPR